MSTSLTPTRLEVRKPSFGLSNDVPRYWYGGDPFATHYMNALSSVFPDGEAFFVRSVRHYRDRIDDPELLRAMQGFAGQEAQHSYQHDLHLAMLDAQGYTMLRRANQVMDRVIRFSNRFAPRFSLATTAGLEHLTALLARRILARGARLTAEMDPRMAELLRWHALEEAEHKSVAFDVLQRVAPSYLLRVFALAVSTLGLFAEALVRTAYMLWRDGLLLERATWASGWKFLFGPEGLLRHQGRDYAVWFRRDFHPSQIDDAVLIEIWQAHFALPAAG